MKTGGRRPQPTANFLCDPRLLLHDGRKLTELTFVATDFHLH